MIPETRPADAVIGAFVGLSPAMCKLNAYLVDIAVQALAGRDGQVPAGTEMLRETLRAGSRLRARQGADVLAVRRPQVPASTGVNAEVVDDGARSWSWCSVAEASQASGMSCGYLRRLARLGQIEGAVKGEAGWMLPSRTRIERRRRRE